jgi:hypothetical protein
MRRLHVQRRLWVTVSPVWQVVVELTPSCVRVEMGEVTPMAGRLWADIKREDSTWTVQVLQIMPSCSAAAALQPGQAGELGF